MPVPAKSRPRPKWIDTEFSGAQLGDARLNKRLQQIAGRLADAPGAGFPKAMGTGAETEGFYRFVTNEKVELESVMGPHVRETAARCEAAAEVVVAIDISQMAFKRDSDAGDLEELTSSTKGFDTFCSLALRRDRKPLGVLRIAPLEKAGGRKGAASWNEAVAETATRLPAAVRAVYVMDREADAYELIAALAAAGRSFVIRAKYDRALGDGDTLRSVTGATPHLLERDIALSRRSGKGKAPGANRKHPPRTTRPAKLAVRACEVALPRPPKLKSGLPASLAVNAILVTEIGPPEDEPAVDWLLLTSEPVGTPAEVERAIDAYRARWVIEEFFKVLKTGCSYEDRQLESRQSLLVALGLLAPIAWRLLLLRSLSRQAPDEPASLALTPLQIHILQAHPDVKLAAKPTLQQALLAVAGLGGHLRHNGPPGWQTIWSGFATVRAWEVGYSLARPEL